MKAMSEQEISEALYRYSRVYEPKPSSEAGNAAYVLEYKEQGFFAAADLLSQDEVEQAIDAIMSLILNDGHGAAIQFTKPRTELRDDRERELAVRKLYDFTKVSPILHHIAYHPAIMPIVGTILGEKPKLAQEMALLKPPHGGGEKPWHQDMAYGNLAYGQPVVGVWIALDYAELDNGCMHVIPRSHMEGAIPHYARRDWQICDTNVQVERDVAVPLAPGGALFFHGLLHHGTPSNNSVKRRRALQFHYVGESAEKLNPKEYKRFFTNEMTNAEC